MFRALLAVVSAALCAGAVAGCSASVRGVASPAQAAATSTARSTAAGELPGGVQPTCFVGGACDGPTGSTLPVGLVCSPLHAAMATFDEQARAMSPGGQVSTPGSGPATGALTDLVIDVVDRCGYQVMVEIADQYPDPLYGWLRSTAVSAMGEISALPAGLRCADLSRLGFTPQQAVDYWFLWGSPGLMDADSNGVPCETVWADVARYMPST
jgi:hypothetical protein